MNLNNRELMLIRDALRLAVRNENDTAEYWRGKDRDDMVRYHQNNADEFSAVLLKAYNEQEIAA